MTTDLFREFLVLLLANLVSSMMPHGIGGLVYSTSPSEFAVIVVSTVSVAVTLAEGTRRSARGRRSRFPSA